MTLTERTLACSMITPVGPMPGKVQSYPHMRHDHASWHRGNGSSSTYLSSGGHCEDTRCPEASARRVGTDSGHESVHRAIAQEPHTGTNSFSDTGIWVSTNPCQHYLRRLPCPRPIAPSDSVVMARRRRMDRIMIVDDRTRDGPQPAAGASHVQDARGPKDGRGGGKVDDGELPHGGTRGGVQRMDLGGPKVQQACQQGPHRPCKRQ